MLLESFLPDVHFHNRETLTPFPLNEFCVLKLLVWRSDNVDADHLLILVRDPDDIERSVVFLGVQMGFSYLNLHRCGTLILQMIHRILLRVLVGLLRQLFQNRIRSALVDNHFGREEPYIIIDFQIPIPNVWGPVDDVWGHKNGPHRQLDCFLGLSVLSRWPFYLRKDWVWWELVEIWSLIKNVWCQSAVYLVRRLVHRRWWVVIVNILHLLMSGSHVLRVDEGIVWFWGQQRG